MLLDGRPLAEHIKRRQAAAVANLVDKSRPPRLDIVQVNDHPVINTYVRLKQTYGRDIGAMVQVHRPPQRQVRSLLARLNKDQAIDGIIVQLPLPEPATTEEIVNQVAPSKDVDGLGTAASYRPATPMAILWLLDAYHIDLPSKKVLLIGRGKLVGAPLENILRQSGVQVQVADRSTTDLAQLTLAADVIITATGSPSILFADMIKSGAVVVDAGVASEEGKTVGDLAPDVYQRHDLTLTPPKGGVGPLTVCALFDNVIQAWSSQNAHRRF